MKHFLSIYDEHIYCSIEDVIIDNEMTHCVVSIQPSEMKKLFTSIVFIEPLLVKVESSCLFTKSNNLVNSDKELTCT